MDDAGSLASRHEVRIDKHTDGDAEGDPDETLTFTEWTEADGSVVTDPARIAALEASAARGH